MSKKLYCTMVSPPSRSVITLLKILDIPHELQIVDLLKGEQYKPEYLKMNPQHTVPVLDDNGFIVSESHTINAYLVNMYGKDDKLYPKEPKARSVVDNRLHFDSSALFPISRNFMLNMLKNKTITDFSPKMLENLEQAYGTLEMFLKNYKFIAGDQATIADISICTTLNMMSFFLLPDEEKHPLLCAYIKRCETDVSHLACVNELGHRVFQKIIQRLKL